MECLRVIRGHFLPGFHISSDDRTGAERDPAGWPGGGIDTGGIYLKEIARGNCFLQEIKVLSAFPFIHPALLYISMCGHAKAGTDSMIRMWKSCVPDGLDIVPQV